MGKKSPKQSPKKQPASATTEDVVVQPVSAQASKLPAAKLPKGKLGKQHNPAKGPTKKGSRSLGSAPAKKETIEERLARQKLARETLLKEGTHDNIEVITAPRKKGTVKRKRKILTEGEDGEEIEEEVWEEVPEWDYEETMAKLITLLEAPGFVAEHDKATETLGLLEGILVEEKQWTTAREVLDRVMTVNAEVTAKVPHETTPRCIIYRVRKFVIDEFTSIVKDQISEESAGLTASSFFREMTSVNEILAIDNYDIPDVPAGVDPVVLGAKVKQGVIASIEEYKTELENIPNLIASHWQIIREGDSILTHSYCPSTAMLFLNAAKHCNFTLYMMESAPLCDGYHMADDLEESGIDMIMVADVNIEMVMPKINTVIMPCRALLHGGECKTLAGGGNVAMMAAVFKVDLYCVAATYQFSPTMVANVNQDLDPSAIGYDSSCPVPVIAHKFNTVDANEVYKVISNNALFTASQTQMHMIELYTPRQEKDEMLSTLMA